VYAGNDPVNAIDPFGLTPCDDKESKLEGDVEVGYILICVPQGSPPPSPPNLGTAPGPIPPPFSGGIGDPGGIGGGGGRAISDRGAGWPRGGRNDCPSGPVSEGIDTPVYADLEQVG
jgi:hypothetical protein